MEPLAIIIPVNAPREGKSRLAGVLSPLEREALNWRLLVHTFDQVAELRDVAHIIVVSKSAEVLAAAAQRGFVACIEPASSDLNAALALAAGQAQTTGADELMVLPVDLPWLTAERLRAVVDEGHSGDVTVITDRAGDGTNLLLWRPVDTSCFHYGVGSAAAHAADARDRGLRMTMRQDPHLSFDLDTPQDLEMFLRNTGAAAPMVF